MAHLMQNGSRFKPLNLKLRGFTLIELLVVLSILALLITIAAPKYFNSLDRARETSLKHELSTIRESIDKFYADRGQYPQSLEELVELKYINKLPQDPITEDTTTWVIEPPDASLAGNVFNIHSGSTQTASDGTKYSEW